MKHSNKSIKRKQNKKSRKRKAGMFKTVDEETVRQKRKKEAIQELKDSVKTAIKINELETITAIQNAIQEAEEAGIYGGDARNIAKPYISFLSQNAIQIAEDKRIYHRVGWGRYKHS